MIAEVVIGAKEAGLILLGVGAGLLIIVGVAVWFKNRR